MAPTPARVKVPRRAEAAFREKPSSPPPVAGQRWTGLLIGSRWPAPRADRMPVAAPATSRRGADSVRRPSKSRWDRMALRPSCHHVPTSGRRLGGGAAVLTLSGALRSLPQGRSEQPGSRSVLAGRRPSTPIAVRGGRAPSGSLPHGVVHGNPGDGLRPRPVAGALLGPPRRPARGRAAIPHAADGDGRPARARRLRFGPRRGPPAPTTTSRLRLPPPDDRDSHLHGPRGRSLQSEQLRRRRGRPQGVGRRVQVPTSRSRTPTTSTRGLLEDTSPPLDDRIHPTAREAASGPARDVDRDGRFTVLCSSWLDRLGGGRHAVDGFVKVADLDPTVPRPFSNHCDMMYLNAEMQATGRISGRCSRTSTPTPPTTRGRHSTGPTATGRARKRRPGSTRRSRTSPRTRTASPRRTSTIVISASSPAPSAHRLVVRGSLCGRPVPEPRASRRTYLFPAFGAPTGYAPTWCPRRSDRRCWAWRNVEAGRSAPPSPASFKDGRSRDTRRPRCAEDRPSTLRRRLSVDQSVRPLVRGAISPGPASARVTPAAWVIVWTSAGTSTHFMSSWTATGSAPSRSEVTGRPRLNFR